MPGTFTHINPIYLDRVWPEVEPLLSRAVAKGRGEIDISQLRADVVRGDVELFVWQDDEGQVETAGIVRFTAYPNYRVAHVSFLGGRYSDESFDMLKTWCRNNGASYIQCWTDDAAGRLYQRYGFEKAYNVMRFKL